mmetsp:Transcript_44554/g.123415  ORF Transcript_44554/g.123415 Transcript_44554/m.123415 type:complete len:123 (+) Transcript_44554:214-582(+)
MKQHREVIDQIQKQMSEYIANQTLTLVQNQLVLAEKNCQREQVKQKRFDEFEQRLNLIQQQLSLGLSGWGCWQGREDEGSAKGYRVRAHLGRLNRKWVWCLKTRRWLVATQLSTVRSFIRCL